MRSALWTVSLAGLAVVNAIPTISVKGSKFFTSDGDQFFVRGKHLLHPIQLTTLTKLQELPISSSPTTRSSTTRNASSTQI